MPITMDKKISMNFEDELYRELSSVNGIVLSNSKFTDATK